MRLARVLALAFAVLALPALALGPAEATDLAPKPGSFNNPPGPAAGADALHPARW